MRLSDLLELHGNLDVPDDLVVESGEIVVRSADPPTPQDVMIADGYTLVPGELRYVIGSDGGVTASAVWLRGGTRYVISLTAGGIDVVPEASAQIDEDLCHPS
jgi:hypothetical protein